MGNYLRLQYDINDVDINNIYISVILPIFNAESTLKNCLNSIIEQTLYNIEVICINDGSTDSSLSILEDYMKRDKRIKTISQENKGVSEARNIGIKHARGKYIAFIDADDSIDYDFLETLYNAAIKCNADIACGSIVRIKNDKKKFLLKFKKTKIVTETHQKYKLAKLPHLSYVWNKIYKIESLKRSNIIFEDGKLYEDIVFSHKILHYLNKMVCVPNTYYYYHINQNSITNSQSEQHEHDLLSASRYIQKFVQEKNICKGVGKHWYSDIVFELYFFKIPLFKIMKYRIFYEYRFLNLPIFLVRKGAEENAKG